MLGAITDLKLHWEPWALPHGKYNCYLKMDNNPQSQKI